MLASPIGLLLAPLGGLLGALMIAALVAIVDAGEQNLKNIANPVRVYRIEPETAAATDAPAPMTKARKRSWMPLASGAALADIQRAASDAGRLFALSLAAEGSCQIGGNLSTNAGGVAVLRYGNARELVLGLEVVLPDGLEPPTEFREAFEVFMQGRAVSRLPGWNFEGAAGARLVAQTLSVHGLAGFGLTDEHPALGHAARVEVVGTEGVLIMDDDHTDQLMYSEKGVPHVYLPDHNVNMVFLQSGTPGDWALGDFWGPIANETRAWLDHLATGKPCVLATPREARATLEATLAIELSVESGQAVRLPLAG